MATRVNRPIAAKNSAAFQIICTAAIVDAGSSGTLNVSNSQIGIQKTDEYAPHGEKSCRSCQSSSEPKNSTRQMPSAAAGPGSNQNRFQASLALFMMITAALQR